MNVGARGGAPDTPEYRARGGAPLQETVCTNLQKFA
jgi:hypothetical protein